MWNSARGVWEKPETVSLLCEHLELYSETWQTSGMMRDGMVFELQKPVLRIKDSEFSYLRSPKASEGEGGALGEAEAMKRGNTVGVRDQVMDLVAAQGQKVSRANLPTPTVADTFTDNLKSSQQKEGSMHSVNLSQAVHLLPTTRAQHGEDRNNKIYARPSDKPQNLENALALLPTPNTMEHRENKSPEQIAELKKRSPGGYRNLREEVVNTSEKDWGKFGHVVKRWETVIGLPAPEPTQPDGKDGAHRLSSKFTEWMMGLEPGWVTGHGLSRKDELKACGNGVVPQQAELALRLLLEVDDV